MARALSPWQHEKLKATVSTCALNNCFLIVERLKHPVCSMSLSILSREKGLLPKALLMAVIIVKLGETIIQTHELGRNPVRIGRARDNEIVVENLSVSRHHARVEFIDNQYVLIDNGSANGIFVNGVKINRAELTDNDVVSIGKHRLHFSTAIQANLPDSPTGEAPDDSLIPPIKAGDGSVVIGAFEVIRGTNIGQIFPISTVRTTLGRSHQNQIRLNDWLVSRVHSSVHYKDDKFTLRDMGSWRGTTINAETIKEKVLKQGDEVLLGNTLLAFKMISPQVAEESTHFGENLRDNPGVVELNYLPLSITQAIGEEPQSTPAAPAPSAPVVNQDVPASLDSIEIDFPVDDLSPLTNEELEALEDDADLTFSGDEDATAESFGKLEVNSPNGLLDPDDEKLRKMEESQFQRPEASELAEDPELTADEDVHRDDAEEEKALFGGPVANVEPGSIDSTPAPSASSTSQQRVISNHPAAAQKQSAQATTGLQPIPQNPTDIPVPQGVDPQVIQRWGHGLQNRSKIIRREAARKLKELTGIDYDWQSGPKD